MIGPHVAFKLPGGGLARVAPGGIIGRTSSASLRLADPRVSEAHALVSLRGREFRLLGLRGRIEVDGQEEGEVILLSGQRIRLGGAVEVEVTDVVISDRILALEFAGEVRELCADTYSLVLGPPPDLVPRFVPDAAAWVWSTDDGWMMREDGRDPGRLTAGSSLLLAGSLLVTAIVVAARAVGSTTAGVDGPLQLVCRTTTVHVHRRSRQAVTVDARAGQLLSELALMGAPVAWATAAEILWPDELDSQKLRRNFDAVLARLRARLREAGIREDLVRLDGRGNIEAFLHPDDQVIDEA